MQRFDLRPWGLKRLAHGLVFFTLLSLKGFTNASADSPNWVHGDPPEKWNRTRYLTAVGSGKSLEEASAQAKKAMAEVILSEVRSQFQKDSQSSLSQNTQGKTDGEDRTSVDAQVQVNTKAEIRGAEIAESFKDPADGAFYALAVLEKLKARNHYSQEAARVKAEIVAKHHAFQESPSARVGTELLVLHEKYIGFEKEFQVFSDGLRLPADLSLEDWEAIKAKAREKRVAEAIVLEPGADSKEVAEELAACMTEKGHAVVSTADKAKAKWVISFQAAEKSQAIQVEGWVKFEVAVSGNVSGGAGGGHFKVAKSATGRSKEQAVAKARTEVQAELCTKIEELLLK